MEVFFALILGVLQGLTEFLPVSSSGHLVIAQSLLPDFEQPGVLFDVILHAGTLIAILLFFRKTLFSLTKNYLLLLVVGTVPAIFVGLIFQSLVEGLFESAKLVGFTLLLTAFINFQTDKARSGKKKESIMDSLIIGAAQAVAIIPGISRSGSTIFAGTKLRLEPNKAAEFSFLLSIPAVLGATFLELITYHGSGNLNLAVYVVGFAAALFSGYLAIGAVFKFLKKRNFKVFGFYCALLGTLLIFLN